VSIAIGSAHNAIAAFMPPLVGPSISGGTEHRTLSVLNGGTQRITGTVKSTGTPNAPVFRRVRLHDQRSGRVISETWSDPVTGAYAFERIAPGPYFVIAFDHTQLYSAVVADNLTPEPMP